MFYEVVIRWGGTKNCYVPLSLAVMASNTAEAKQIAVNQKGIRRDLGNPIIFAREFDGESYISCQPQQKRPVFKPFFFQRLISSLKRLHRHKAFETKLSAYQW